jgi:NAD(P)-dependent dehydrogenase (short-subunit alcohol dehydrogenase family)
VVDAALVERVMNTNFLGPVNCLEALQPQLVAGNRVVLVSSMAHWLPFPRAEAYGASKAALSWFAESLRLDWEPKGIAVTVVSPGFVDTPLTRKNDFAMPGRVSVDEAVKAIRIRLAAGKMHIAFPAGLASFCGCSPGCLRFFSARCCAGWCVHEHCDYRQRHCRADLRLAAGRAPSGDPV